MRYPLVQQLARAQVRLTQARQRLELLPLLQTWPRPRAQQPGLGLLQLLISEANSTLIDGAAPALLTLRLTVLAFEAGEIQQLLAGAG